MLGALLAVALPIFGASRIWPENRRLQRRLAAQRADEVPFSADAVMIENLVSLAVASSMAAEARSGRLQRRIGAVIGAIGVFGWAGAAAAVPALASQAPATCLIRCSAWWPTCWK
jgi:hypothetical protein